jgi:hypothetical protein
MSDNNLDNNNYYIRKDGLIPSFFSQVSQNFQKLSWLRRLFETFTPIEQRQASQLSGRIQQMHEDVNEVRRQLENIKQELNDEVDEDLRPLVKEVLDPLLREIDKQRALHEEEAIQKYSSWTENARRWVQIYAKKKDKEEIIEALAKHVVQKTFDRIDRDLHFILDYIEHHVNESGFSIDERIAAKNRLIREITPYMIRLTSLKIPPDTHSLVEIGKWKEFLDMQREELLHAALQIIET